MSVIDLLNDNTNAHRFSFEVLPPLKGNGTETLFRNIDKLGDLDPLYINITTHHSEYIYRELKNWSISVIIFVGFSGAVAQVDRATAF